MRLNKKLRALNILLNDKDFDNYKYYSSYSLTSLKDDEFAICIYLVKDKLLIAESILKGRVCYLQLKIHKF